MRAQDGWKGKQTISKMSPGRGRKQKEGGCVSTLKVSSLGLEEIQSKYNIL